VVDLGVNHFEIGDTIEWWDGLKGES